MEYYKDPAKTKEAIRGGYWHSGDLGMINEKGHLKFADRLKDYLRIGGENAWPRSMTRSAFIGRMEGLSRPRISLDT
jgi:fatty-acyl-CoA synthase